MEISNESALPTATKAFVFSSIGASNHTDHQRPSHDYYATDPSAAEWLLKLETLNKNILEPACGEEHLAKVLTAHGHNVTARDITNYGYGQVADFLSPDNVFFDGDIVTNPPYSLALPFCQKAVEIIPQGNKVCMFLRTLFLEGLARRKFFDQNPPHTIWVSSRRICCARNGDFLRYRQSVASYSWFVWHKGFRGAPTVKWFNP